MADSGYPADWPSRVPRDLSDHFAVGDLVQCYNSSRLYEAKILAVGVLRLPRHPDGQQRFLVHYINWSRRFDEWVPRAYIMHSHLAPRLQQLILDHLALWVAREDEDPPVSFDAKKIERMPDDTPLQTVVATESTLQLEQELTAAESEDGEERGRKLKRKTTRKEGVVGASPAEVPARRSGVRGRRASSSSWSVSSTVSPSASPTTIAAASPALSAASPPTIAAPSPKLTAASLAFSTTAADGDAGVETTQHDGVIEVSAAAVKSRGIKLTKAVLAHLVAEEKQCRDPAHVMTLPFEPTMREIEDKFRDWASHRFSHTSKEDVINALHVLFDISVGALLLYDSERPAHDLYFAANPETKPHTVYGIDHLQRLIVKLPAVFKENPQLFTKQSPVHRKALCLILNEFVGYYPLGVGDKSR